MVQTTFPSAVLVKSVTLTRWNDLDFPVAASSGFEDLPSLPAFAKGKDYMSIIRNNHSLAAKAYTVVWTFEAEGRAHSVHMQYVQKHRMSLAATKPIPPTASRLVSPSFNMSIIEFGIRKSNMIPAIPDAFPYPGAQVTGSYIDAVIFADHSMEGPDAMNLRDRWVAVRHAEHDAEVAVVRLLKQGMSAQAISTRLAERTKFYQGQAFGVMRTAPKIAPMYWFARSQEAANLRYILDRQGIAALTQAAEQRMKYAPESLARPVAVSPSEGDLL